MHNAGQFLVDPREFLGWFNINGVFSAFGMLFMLSRYYVLFFRPLNSGISINRFTLGLGLGGLLSVLTTIILTSSSYLLYETAIGFTNSESNQQSSGAIGNHVRTNEHNASIAHAKIAHSAGNLAKNKSAVIASLLAILLIAIGAGYAFTMLNLSFGAGLLAMSIGIGLPEELCKAATGLFLLYLIFDTKSLSRAQFKLAAIAAFGISGLGFGAGEAFKYFGVYARLDAGIFWYVVRAFWCVSLHGSWTLLVGGIIGNYLPQDPTILRHNKSNLLILLLSCSIPTAIVHGLYNTYCMRDDALFWLVGIVSLFSAWLCTRLLLNRRELSVSTESIN